jgi:oligoribonuclease NrnB/cAMP/cGMP phosphodiesterase (DHH superfamily)
MVTDTFKEGAEAKMDGSTHFIKNIVFARDVSILDRETLHVNQREAFSHENNLDVKKMMHRRTSLIHDDAMSYRMAALQRSPLNRRIA